MAASLARGRRMHHKDASQGGIPRDCPPQGGRIRARFGNGPDSREVDDLIYTAEDLAADPRFIHSIQLLAGQLRGQFERNPRLSRYLASHQRWLLTQAAFALHLEYDPASGTGGLTTMRLKEMITSIRAASRNTVLNYLDQLLSYRFMRVIGDPARRPRRFEATEISYEAMHRWLAANLLALDFLDKGGRAATFSLRPDLFRIMQPRIARQCIDDSRWRDPPERVALFLWTEAGGLVMDEIVNRVDAGALEAECYDIGRIDARMLAERFMMSRTHLQRLLRKAVEAGCLEWHDPARKAHMGIRRDYLMEYLGWQAVKFSIISEAFAFALAHTAPADPALTTATGQRG